MQYTIRYCISRDRERIKKSIEQSTAEAKRRKILRREAKKVREEQLREKEGVTYESGRLLSSVSNVSFALFFLSNSLEQKFGHRTDFSGFDGF